jgi:PAS domain-containing protein
MFDWESVFNVIDVGVIVIDEHLCIAGWNEWIAKTTELSASSVRGRNLFEVFEGLKTARLESAIADAFQFGTSTLLTHSLNKLFPLRNEVGQLHTAFCK